MDELFAPPDPDWQRLAPQYLSMRRLTTVVVPLLVATVPALLVGGLSGRWWISGLFWAVAVVVVVARLAILRRNWLSWGYAERDADLYLTHGVLFRELVAVPYGRMQVVEVGSGPLQRAFGLATVTMRTASPRTGASIPGLLPAEAARLRDRLTERGESQAIAL